jgi:hypothetical protein
MNSPSQETTIIRVSSKTKKNRAAKIIQKNYRNYIKRKRLIAEMNKPDTCITEPIPVGNENVYMYLKRSEHEEIPLFTIFNFKETTENIIKSTKFFNDFYKAFYGLKRHPHGNYFTFLIQIDRTGQITIKYNKNNITNSDNIQLYSEYFYPYIFYILANCKFTLTGNSRYVINILHPKTEPSLVGLHKDDTIRTCLTYVNSPVSTELVFDEDIINLDWLKCSPIFRFDTSDKFYTLCFNDKYIYHTPPIYEKEGETIQKTNELEIEDEIVRKDDKFYLKDYDADGIVREQLIPKRRQLVPEHKNRKVLMCFIDEPSKTINISDYKLGTTINMVDLESYKLHHKEEKIELTEKSIQIIMNEEYLGAVKQKGGKTTRKYKYKG